MGRAKTYMTFASLLANKLTGECYMRVVRLQTTIKDDLTCRVFFNATIGLSSAGKVRKLEISGMVLERPAKEGASPVHKNF